MTIKEIILLLSDVRASGCTEPSLEIRIIKSIGVVCTADNLRKHNTIVVVQTCRRAAGAELLRESTTPSTIRKVKGFAAVLSIYLLSS